MVDPANITNFHRTDNELEEFAIFAVLVAGKTAKTVAPRLENILKHRLGSPLEYMGFLDYYGDLAGCLKSHGIGCYNQKAQSIGQLARYCLVDRVLNLEVCQPHHLQVIDGIGPKTSRFFILHSRAGARLAALDTHILKGLRRALPPSIKVPTSTPTSEAEYRRLEDHFLMICDQKGQSPAELDLMWWREFSGNQA